VKKAVSSFAAAIREVASTPFYAVMAGLCVAYAAVIWSLVHVSVPIEAGLFITYNELALILGFFWLLLFVPLRLVYIMAVRRPRYLFREIGADFGPLLFDPRRWVGMLLILVTLLIFFPFFTLFKTQLVLWHPFQFDQAITRLDRFIHGGHTAYEVFMPVFGSPFILYLISFPYWLWFAIKFLVLYWQAFSSSRPALRAQFFLSYILAWIVNGTVLALAFSSAGPCYFGRVCPNVPDPYSNLMTHLNQVNAVHELGTFKAQQYLWDQYASNNAAVFAGISAFPSIHVTVTFMILLLTWSYGWGYRLFGFLFYISILLGSILLGWHYASDGYFGTFSALLIWLFSGWLVRKYDLARPRLPAIEASPVAETLVETVAE
jgi:hypothetical protein